MAYVSNGKIQQKRGWSLSIIGDIIRAVISSISLFLSSLWHTPQGNVSTYIYVNGNGNFLCRQILLLTNISWIERIAMQTPRIINEIYNGDPTLLQVHHRLLVPAEVQIYGRFGTWALQKPAGKFLSFAYRFFGRCNE